MLIASGPSASATAMAVRTISSRDSPRSRGGRPPTAFLVPLDVIGETLIVLSVAPGPAGRREHIPRPAERPRLRAGFGGRGRTARAGLGARGGRSTLGAVTALTGCVHACSSCRPRMRYPMMAREAPSVQKIFCSLVHRTAMVHRTRHVQRTSKRGAAMSEPPAIAAEGLDKNYGKTKALAGFDLTVPPGTVYGLLGPNGAGKTTAVRVFATLMRPDGGRAQA